MRTCVRMLLAGVLIAAVVTSGGCTSRDDATSDTRPTPTVREVSTTCTVDPIGVMRRRGASIEETSARSDLTAARAIAGSVSIWDDGEATRTVAVIVKAVYSSDTDARFQHRLVWIIGIGPRLVSASAKHPPVWVQEALVLDANTGQLLEAGSESIMTSGQ